MKTVTIQVINFEEFKLKLIKQLAEEYAKMESYDIAEILIEEGFSKLDKNNLQLFFNNNPFNTPVSYQDTVLVDIGDSMFYWLVSGSSCILIKK